VETLKAWVRGRWYELSAADAKRLRPTFVRSERAIANEKYKAERLARLRRSQAPIYIDADDGESYAEPQAPEILPAVRRGGATETPYDDSLDVVWPSGS
jgi:hypothetical protein